MLYVEAAALHAPATLCMPSKIPTLIQSAHMELRLTKHCDRQGTSRYEVITQPAKPIRYSFLRGSGHALFTGTPLSAPLTIIGWPVAELWVASSDTDADVFVYLEDYDPSIDKARCGVCGTCACNCSSGGGGAKV